MNVPADVVEVATCLHWDGLVPSLVNSTGPCRALCVLPQLRVQSSKTSHELRHLAAGSWPKDEMKVVRHEAVIEYAYIRGFLGPQKKALRGDIVGVRVEKLHSLGRAVQNVIDEFPLELCAPGHSTAQSKRSTV